MKIVQYLDFTGSARFGYIPEDKRGYKITGYKITAYKTTREPDHKWESGMKIPDFPILFFKALNAFQNPDDLNILLRYLESKEELVVIIGKIYKNVSRTNALNYVFGYTCANDIIARNLQFKYGGGQWYRSKTFDSFCPLGPHIVAVDEIKNTNSQKIKTILNGRTVQEWNTKDMIFDV